MNERETKLGLDGDPRGVCSVTGRPCRCHPERGCAAGESKLDPPERETVRWLRVARLRLDAAKVALDTALGGEELLVRKYPKPEIREVRRKVVTAIGMIDEIGGEL